jgi:predicted nucleic acid-binding Zn ribbon protein
LLSRSRTARRTQALQRLAALARVMQALRELTLVVGALGALFVTRRRRPSQAK